MLRSELILSLRGMDMVIFAICLPVVMVILLGIIYGDKPAFEGAHYSFLEQSIGAIATIGIAAGGVMGLPLVISDYREKGILKRFKTTPIRPSMIIMVEMVMYAIYSLVSLILVFLTAMLFFGAKFRGNVFVFIGTFFFVMIAMFSIGTIVGGISPNAKVASILASLLYFPMLIFSGATLPYEVMPTGLQKAVSIMPLTQGIKLLKASILGLPLEGVLVGFIGLILMTIICLAIAIRHFRWE